MPAGSGTVTSAASTCCWPPPRPASRPARCCATRASRPNASRRKSCAPPGRRQTAGRAGGLDAEALASIGIDLDVVRARIEAAFGPDALTRALPAPPAPAASLGEGPAGRADAPPAPPSRPPPRPPACRAVPATSRFCRARSRRPYPVHAAREKDPGAVAARGGGAARQLHRRPAPHPGPAEAAGRHGTGDPVSSRRTGHIAARRHPRPPPQGELTGAYLVAIAREPFNSGPDDDMGDVAGSPAGHVQDAVQATAGPCARTAG